MCFFRMPKICCFLAYALGTLSYDLGRILLGTHPRDEASLKSLTTDSAERILLLRVPFFSRDSSHLNCAWRIDLKPNTWLDEAELARRVRPRPLVGGGYARALPRPLRVAPSARPGG